MATTLNVCRTHSGWHVTQTRNGEKFPVYLKTVYKSRGKWISDYTYAKTYKTEKSARDTIRKIERGQIAI